MKRPLLLLFFASTVFVIRAQALSGQVTGRITDKRTGFAIRSVTVSSFNSYDKANRKTQTDADGHYTLDSLAPGSYNLMFSCKGYALKIITGVLIYSDKTTMLDVELRPEGKKKKR
jgi:hypothetical protein